MNSIWNAKDIAFDISAGAIHSKMSDAACREIASIPDLEAKVACALFDPKPMDIVMPVFNAVLAAQYRAVFEAVGLPKSPRIYEPCVGGSNPVILAGEAHSGGTANYVALNLNQKLREQLREKIAHHASAIQIIEEHAEEALSHLQPASFDAACFHHAVNDILQTAVSEPRGMDTTAIDWFPNERQMIEWLAEDVSAGRLESRGKPELMKIIGDAVRLVRPGGHLIFDHFNWCKFIGVDWFPWVLFYNFIPMTRRWIGEFKMPVEELNLPGVDQQWWMILRRKI